MGDVATTAQMVTTTTSSPASISTSAGVFSAIAASSMIHMDDSQIRGSPMKIRSTTELTHPVEGLFNPTLHPKLDYLPKRGRPSKSKMDVHISEKYLRCPHCPFSTLYPNNLARHQNKHTGVRPYTCSECPYAASQKEHLTTHMRRHTGERPFTCPHCPYEAARQDRLNSHLKIHVREQASLLASQSSPQQPGSSTYFESDPDVDISAPLDMSAHIERHRTADSPENSLRHSPNQISIDNPEHSPRQSLRNVPRASYEDYSEIYNENDD
ncbi:unnamed protein product [Meganyctiphanes norvegica]|uniref:C2H2-type domain-containing protein n=1 Tax=Meganyctiphanes norvegica TaxID=48144 RepID=A0AAV2QCF6_MEGNR